jgi:hypothetical protein
MKELLFLTLILILFSCTNDPVDSEMKNCASGSICYTENGISKSFETSAEMHTDGVLVIGDLFEISIKIHQLKEGKYFFSAGTLDEARAVRYTPDSLILDHFTSSYQNDFQGELEITSYNIEIGQISGVFHFEMIQFTGTEEKVLNFIDGEFSDLEIIQGNSINSAGTFKGIIEPSPFDSLAFYFINVLDFNDRLELSMAHTTGNRFIIKFPKNLFVGEHTIQETQLSDTDLFQIKLQTERTGEPYYIPSIDEPLVLQLIEYDELSKNLLMDLTGKLEQENGVSLNLKNFRIELHSW